MVFSIASSLSSLESLTARGLMSCGNASAALETGPIVDAAAKSCGITEEMRASDYEFPVDLCTEGDDDECDTVAEIATLRLCTAMGFVDGLAAGLKESCTEAEIDTMLTANGWKPAAYDLEYLGMLACDGGKIKHVCLAGENAVLDIDDLVADADDLANGEDGEDGDAEDSAAGLVALAGVSLAAAAMLA